MERRTVIRYLFVVAGGTAILPSCLQRKGKASFVLNHLKIDEEQERSLAEMAETIIPASATPGAKDTYAHLFALRMVDDCYEKEAREKFMKGFKQVEDLAEKKSGRSFYNSSAQQRAEIFRDLETQKAPEEALQFYKDLKGLTMQGYLSSKPVLGDIFKYELAPARYNGAAPVKKIIHQV